MANKKHPIVYAIAMYGFTSYLWILQIGVNWFLGMKFPAGGVGSSATATAITAALRILCYEMTAGERNKLAKDPFLRRKWRLVLTWAWVLLVVGLIWWPLALYAFLDVNYTSAPAYWFRTAFLQSGGGYAAYTMLSVAAYLGAIGLSELKVWIFEQ